MLHISWENVDKRSLSDALIVVLTGPYTRRPSSSSVGIISYFSWRLFPALKEKRNNRKKC